MSSVTFNCIAGGIDLHGGTGNGAVYGDDKGNATLTLLPLASPGQEYSFGEMMNTIPVLHREEKGGFPPAASKSASSEQLIRAAYFGSDPAVSRKLCLDLEAEGPLGKVAAQLFRVQKASSRAKVYRGGVPDRKAKKSKSKKYKHLYRDLSYQRKDEQIEKLCSVLRETSLSWGWGEDRRPSVPRHVLYVDLPQGQVSYHCYHRYPGPAYTTGWDGEGMSEGRVIAFCTAVLDGLRPIPST